MAPKRHVRLSTANHVVAPKLCQVTHNVVAPPMGLTQGLGMSLRGLNVVSQEHPW